MRNDDRFVEPVVEINDLVLIQQLTGHRQGGAADEQSHHTVRVSKVLNVIRVENRGIGKRLDGPPLRALFKVFGIDAGSPETFGVVAPSLVATHQEQWDHHEKQLYPGMPNASSNHCTSRWSHTIYATVISHERRVPALETHSDQAVLHQDSGPTQQTRKRRFIIKGRLPRGDSRPETQCSIFRRLHSRNDYCCCSM